jgi:hypothetical protein
MNEFEWRKGMKDLGGPVQPPNDLWLSIAARIENEPRVAAPATRRRWALPFAAAASFAVVAFALAVLRAPTVDSTGDASAEAAIESANRQFESARPQDPRLAGAVIELDSAAAELEQMLKQQPDAVFLVGLLNRTNERRSKLVRMGQASS